MYGQQERGRVDVRQRLAIVGNGRAVGRPDLGEARSGRLEDLRNLEGAADRDELAAGDERATAAREGRQSEQHGGGVVVDGDRVGSAEDVAGERAHVVLAPAALAARRVVFERRVAPRRFGDGRARLGAERRPPEVRMEENARGVDCPDEGRRKAAVERAPRGLEKRPGGRLSLRDGAPQLLLDRLPAIEPQGLPRALRREQGVHRGGPDRGGRRLQGPVRRSTPSFRLTSFTIDRCLSTASSTSSKRRSAA